MLKFKNFAIILLLAMSPLSALEEDSFLLTFKARTRSLLHGERVDPPAMEEHYRLAKVFFEKKDWKRSIRHANVILENGPTSLVGAELAYLRALAALEMQNLELSLESLDLYLKMTDHSIKIEEVMALKFEIAKRYATNCGLPLFGAAPMPRWEPSLEASLAIFDEIVMALPRHPLALEATFLKAQTETRLHQYSEAIDLYHTITERFPRHEKAIESYVKICECYLLQADYTYPNPHYLEQAKAAALRFAADFPGEERLAVADQSIRDLEELFASSLLEVASFFEKKGRQDSAALYYRAILSLYPGATSSVIAESRLGVLTSDGNSKVVAKG